MQQAILKAATIVAKKACYYDVVYFHILVSQHISLILNTVVYTSYCTSFSYSFTVRVGSEFWSQPQQIGELDNSIV